MKYKLIKKYKNSKKNLRKHYDSFSYKEMIYMNNFLAWNNTKFFKARTITFSFCYMG